MFAQTVCFEYFHNLAVKVERDLPILEPHTHNILCGTDVTALVADSDPRFDLICLEVAAGEVKDLGLSGAGHLSVTVIAGLPHR